MSEPVIDPNHHFTKTETAREGRENQVYTEKGARVVAGTIIVDSSSKKVLLVSSTSHRNQFIFPKGGVENDERDDYAATALRETWEEAGVTGTLGKKLDPPIYKIVTHPRILAILPKPDTFPYTEFNFYELEFGKMESVWPEGDKRDRVWADPEEAIRLLTESDRPEMIEALKRTSLFKA